MNTQELADELPKHAEITRQLSDFVGRYLDEEWGDQREPERNWQPSDLLPDLEREEEAWLPEVREVREQAQTLSDELLVVLVGDMITEEALPTYLSWLNRFEGAKDATGVSDTGWGRWARSWTAEENRHGDVLNRYLYLSGRVDVRAVEESIQHILRNGWNLSEGSAGHDPYVGFIYTSFQERATKISHRNVARLAAKAGDENLKRICGIIAGDEGSHEQAYKTFMKRIFREDPEGAVRTFAYMMEGPVTMPGELMADRQTDAPKLFEHYADVAQRLGVYTSSDYADILEHLVQTWNVPDLEGLSGEAARAQDYLCGLADRYRRLAEHRRRQDDGEPTRHSFSWLYGREA